MRVESISLTWFRGSADTIKLDLASKSAVIYGENGAGKSTFVDAIEYVLHEGRIGHLSHEYSGKHQEKGLINTHAPDDKKAELSITLGDGTSLTVSIDHGGTSVFAGNGAATIRSWDYGRTVLRQDEVAAFIRETKGGKYSSILPLLGLRSMEAVAENTRQLAKAVEQRSNLREGLGKTEALLAKRVEAFGGVSDQVLDKKVCDLHTDYCPGATATEPLSQCEGIKTAIADRMARYSDEQRRHSALLAMGSVQLKPLIDSVRLASSALIETVEPMLEKLEVLRTAGQFADTLQGEQEVQCPACGRSVSSSEFRGHVRAESERVQESMQALERRKNASQALVDALKSLRSTFGKPEARAWLTQQQMEPARALIDALDMSRFQDSPSEVDLHAIDEKLVPAIARAHEAAKEAPPDVQDLSRDARLVELLAEIISGRSFAAQLARAASLKAFLQKLEAGIREEIKTESQRVIDDLSTSIESMWATLHPGEAIEGVRLYLAEGVDKAIDIELKFFGVEQPSPRLTLSEGYRNSLGLCIFLAMAKREAESDRPLFLDDVVVSLDRNHRGMIVELLEKEFSDRQVVIFTHDRDWYAELSQQLDGKSWTFRALLPFEKPDLGIRWSAVSSTFGDARAFLQQAPHAAGNTARKIMDTELGLRTERLNVRLPHRGFTKNDRRTAHDFLFQLIADGPKCFQKQGATGFEANPDAIDAWKAADKLLITWGNKASHSMDMVRPEAEKLINACETALEAFKCKNCNKPVYKLDDDKGELTQCQCGHLRWRYGKA
jgi:recombinational DNA repair ATPase RecF/DNA-directed RNA polymerase subunit RPC12/RpoP